MENAIKLENISNLITSPSSYQCRETTVNMKVSGLWYRVVSPSFINSALKNEIWKIPLQIFVFWML